MTDQTIDAPPPEPQAPDDAPGRPGWFWLVLLGVVLILAGASAIAAPFVASLAVAAWIGALFVVSGVFQLAQAFGATGWKGGLWHVANGGLYLLGGLLIVFEPLAGLVALSWLVVATLALCGAARVLGGLALRPAAGWIWILLGGVATLVAAVAIGALMPQAGLTLLGVAAGVSFLIEGAAAIATGLAARRA